MFVKSDQAHINILKERKYLNLQSSHTNIFVSKDWETIREENVSNYHVNLQETLW